jgi:hypothetical protein
MSTPIHAIVSGTFTSDGNPLNISIPSGYNKFEMFNITDLGSTAANNNVMIALGLSSMSAGSAIYTPKTSGAATLDPPVTITSGGFTFLAESASTAIGSSVAITAITAANPAVVSTGTTTGLVASSSVVRIYNETNMQQISSMDFTIGTISAGVSFQLKYLNASGFAAAGTTGAYRIINALDRFYPRRRFITAITAANPAVITLSVTHGYTAGQAVRIYVPSQFGMTQMNGLLGNITAVSTANNTITVDIDSSAFTAFAFPTSAIAAAGVSFPIVVPVGETAINSSTYPYGNLLDDATDNQSISGITVGGTVQTTGKLYQYIAQRGVSV